MEKEDINQSTSAVTESKMDETTCINLETHEPSLLNKIMQVYWALPKSWRLNEFRVEQGMVYISTMNGKCISASISDCEFTYQSDKYERMEYQVKAGDRKLHFKELPGMLEDEEWELIKKFILGSCNAQLSKIGKLVNVLKSINKLLGKLNEE